MKTRILTSTFVVGPLVAHLSLPLGATLMQVVPEPGAGGGTGGEPVHGPYGFNDWSGHDKRCVSVPSCPGSTSLAVWPLAGTTCTYCAETLEQGACIGRPPQDCTQVEYRVPSGPPSCGAFWYRGTVDTSGNCVGAMESTTQVCYRRICHVGLPS